MVGGLDGNFSGMCVGFLENDLVGNADARGIVTVRCSMNVTREGVNSARRGGESSYSILYYTLEGKGFELLDELFVIVVSF